MPDSKYILNGKGKPGYLLISDLNGANQRSVTSDHYKPYKGSSIRSGNECTNVKSKPPNVQKSKTKTQKTTRNHRKNSKKSQKRHINGTVNHSTNPLPFENIPKLSQEEVAEWNTKLQNDSTLAVKVRKSFRYTHEQVKDLIEWGIVQQPTGMLWHKQYKGTKQTKTKELEAVATKLNEKYFNGVHIVHHRSVQQKIAKLCNSWKPFMRLLNEEDNRVKQINDSREIKDQIAQGVRDKEEPNYEQFEVNRPQFLTPQVENIFAQKPASGRNVYKISSTSAKAIAYMQNNISQDGYSSRQHGPVTPEVSYNKNSVSAKALALHRKKVREERKRKRTPDVVQLDKINPQTDMGKIIKIVAKNMVSQSNISNNHDFHFADSLKRLRTILDESTHKNKLLRETHDAFPESRISFDERLENVGNYLFTKIVSEYVMPHREEEFVSHNIDSDSSSDSSKASESDSASSYESDFEDQAGERVKIVSDSHRTGSTPV